MWDIADLTAQVTFDLPFYLNLGVGPYEVCRGNWTAVIRHERVKQEHVDQRLGIAQSSGELKRDRYGRLNYSRLFIELPGKDLIEIELRRQVAAGSLESKDGVVQIYLTQATLSEYVDVAFKEALAAVNRLIEVYRHVTDEFHVTRIPMQEIFTADLHWLHNGEVFQGTWHLGFGQGLTMEPTPMTAETLQALQDRLSTTEEVPLPWELFLDAKDRLDRRDDRQAVIDARTSLEVFLDQLLLANFTTVGLSIGEVGRVLDVNVQRYNIQEVEEALQYSNINRKLGHALKQTIDLDLHDGSPELWKSWLKAKNLREKGVHKGQTVQHDDAVEAVNCMGEIITKMRQSLRNAAWYQDQLES